jgi:hypothetical protein
MKLLYYRCTDSFWPGLLGALVVTDLWLAVLFGHITVATSTAQQLSGSHSQIPCFPGLGQVTNINTTDEYAPCIPPSCIQPLEWMHSYWDSKFAAG